VRTNCSFAIKLNLFLSVDHSRKKRGTLRLSRAQENDLLPEGENPEERQYRIYGIKYYYINRDKRKIMQRPALIFA